MIQALRRFGIDRLAITLSGLCLVHCLAGVLLFSLFAVLGDALVDPIVHEIGLALAIPLAGVALGRGFLNHRRAGPLALGAFGICLMAVGLLVRHGTPAEVVLTVIGVSFVATAHYLNRRACA